jgi:hypothetical protein
MDTHPSCQVAEEFVIFGLFTGHLDAERGIGKAFLYHADEFDYILRHK